MIEINLLPEELRPKRTSSIDFSQVLQAKVVFIIVGCAVALHLLLIGVGLMNNKRVNAMRLKWQGLTSKSKEIERLQKELKEVKQKVPLIEQLIENRVCWAQKLSQASNLIVSGLWLSEFSVRAEKEDLPGQGEQMVKMLTIRGSAASRTKDEPALIGIFMQNLKDDPSFSADFSDIELGPIRKRMIKDTEVMDFVLFCRFKPEREKALQR